MDLPMTFGQALECAKLGMRVARTGWNGKNMYVYALKLPGYDQCMVMKTASGSRQLGWLASQADMFSEDWVKVEAVHDHG